jgi:ketosteroid isomerase-like protein
MTALISKAAPYQAHRNANPSQTTARRFRPSIDIEQVRANWTLVEQHYKAIQAKDADAILAVYAADCRIDHPLIGRMSKDEFSKAVQAFIRQTPDYELEFQISHAGAQRVDAEWALTHVFHLTGRTIRLAGATTYFLSANRITRHIDQFDRRAWSRQAMGMTGLVLSFVPGWRSFVERELRRALGISPQ